MSLLTTTQLSYVEMAKYWLGSDQSQAVKVDLKRKLVKDDIEIPPGLKISKLVARELGLSRKKLKLCRRDEAELDTYLKKSQRLVIADVLVQVIELNANISAISAHLGIHAALVWQVMKAAHAAWKLNLQEFLESQQRI